MRLLKSSVIIALAFFSLTVSAQVKLTDKELEITADLAKAGLISYDSSYNKHIIGDFWTRKSFDNDPRTFGLIELYHFADKYSGDKLPNARIRFVNGWEIRFYTVPTKASLKNSAGSPTARSRRAEPRVTKGYLPIMPSRSIRAITPMISAR